MEAAAEFADVVAGDDRDAAEGVNGRVSPSAAGKAPQGSGGAAQEGQQV